MTADAVGGIWRYALDLARELGAAGREVCLATMGPAPDRAQRDEAATVPGLTLAVGDYRLEWMDDSWTDVDAAAGWLRDLEATWAPDVVHLNGFAHGALAWRAPAVVVAHSCVTSWWHAVEGCAPPPAWDEYRRRVGAGIAAADAVIAPTAAMADAIGRHYGPPRRARVIPNGVDPAAYRRAPKEPFALTVGRPWDPAKNVRVLADVAGALPWPVRIVGDDAHPGGGRASWPGVRLCGRLPHDEVRALFARAALYVHPARYEPFGLAPVEAALSRCALVVADIPSLREVWGDAAVYVPPDDRRALRDALEHTMTDAAGRRDLAERAFARGRRLTAARAATRYLATYGELVAGRVAA